MARFYWRNLTSTSMEGSLFYDNINCVLITLTIASLVGVLVYFRGRSSTTGNSPRNGFRERKVRKLGSGTRKPERKRGERGGRSRRMTTLPSGEAGGGAAALGVV